MDSGSPRRGGIGRDPPLCLCITHHSQPLGFPLSTVTHPHLSQPLTPPLPPCPAKSPSCKHPFTQLIIPWRTLGVPSPLSAALTLHYSLLNSRGKKQKQKPDQCNVISNSGQIQPDTSWVCIRFKATVQPLRTTRPQANQLGRKPLADRSSATCMAHSSNNLN